MITRKLLLISILCSGFNAQAQFNFYRTDSIVVRNGIDTLDYAWAGGMNFCQFNSIDIDLDGKKDLFAFDRTFNQPLVFINKGGTGQIKYKYSPQYEPNFPALLNWVLLRDYNCDGKEDIFSYSPGGMAVYKNISDTILKFVKVESLLRGIQCSSLINIYVSSIDIPSIEDIDYDGDLDILTFGIFGTFVEYHKNYSVELGYGCDSLEFTMKNQCWGHFKEDNDSCIISLFQTQPNCAGVGTPELAPYDPYYQDVITILDPQESTNHSLTRHTGSTLLAIDMNGINSKDLILSDISCKNMEMLTNGGSGPNLDSDMILKDETFPTYDIPINIDLFPAAFYVDVNNDNKRDLVAAPNSYTLSNNTDGNWLYLNTGTDTTPVFQHTEYGFMQKDMLENGEGALPVLFDHNMDGLKDLVIANYGIYDTSGIFIPYFKLYQNTGTATQPTYTLLNSNYANVFAAIGKEALYPSFGDLDNDGDEDMIVGDYDGNIHYFTNIAGAGFPASFTLTGPMMTDNLGAIIDVGKYATPTMVDLDRDGDLDLVIGEQNAVLNYYQNTGTTSLPVFTFITNALGGVDVSESWTPNGYSVPAFYDNAGEYTLFVGALHGVLYQFDSIDGNLTGNFTLLDSLGYYNKVGGRVGVAVDKLNADALPDLIMGNYRGGLALFYGTSDNTSNIHESTNSLEIGVYPNPANDQINVRMNEFSRYTYAISDMSGKTVLSGNFNSYAASIELSNVKDGVYVLQIRSQRGEMQVARIVKCSLK
jgi:Secretion system C-terminal sorting domain/FG-GAP-like repeat